jgi:TPR repeat protein
MPASFMSAFSNNSSGANSSGQQIGASTAASVLASAEAILAQNDHPIELLPELGDDAGWSEIKVSYALSLPQILALKKMIKTQQASPGKGSTSSSAKSVVDVVVDEDFSLSPAAVLKNCLAYVADVTVLESLIGPGNCLLNLLPAVEPTTRVGITAAVIEAVVTEHRNHLIDLAVKPNIDIELLLVIRRYTLQRPIPFFTYVNRVLNTADRSDLENIAPFMRLLIKALYAMEDSGYGATAQAYRGVKVGTVAALKYKFDNCETVFKQQQLITFAAFTSATKGNASAIEFGDSTGGDSIFFHFLTVRGVDVSSISQYPNEQELLVVPPSVFRVDGIFRLEGKLAVQLTHVDQEDAYFLCRTILTNESVTDLHVVIDMHMNNVWIGSKEDWEKLKQLADGGHPLAAAMVAICYSYSSICIIPNNSGEAVSYANRSLAWLNGECARGNKYAQYCLGEFNRLPTGVPKHFEEAVRLLRLASEQSYAPALCTLGFCYEKGTGLDQDVTQAARLYRLAADQGNVRAQCNVGGCYVNGWGVVKDTIEAVRWYRLAAHQGYANAQCNLGLCYENGRGVAKDEMEAVRWYRLAADQGPANAQWNLGLCYENGRGVAKDETEAVRWYRLAADQGYANAQWHLGLCYANGWGVAKDETEAVRYYRLAADQGLAHAQNNVGVCYRNGRGVTIAKTEAVRYYRLAADQGLAIAQCNLGLCYENGWSVARDETEAVRYYRLAAGQGLANAQSNLGGCYRNGRGVAKDETVAVRYYRLAADQGLANAQWNLGLCYEDGRGVTKNVVEAVRWYRLAADQGHANAQWNLGLCYEVGRGVAKDEMEAVRYYRLAAGQGLADAQWNLGLCYAHGWGVAQDETEAVRYYRLAADQGLALAQWNLGFCYDNGRGVAKVETEAVRYYRLAADQGFANA